MSIANYKAAAVIGLIILLGSLLLIHSHALTAVINLEPENGTSSLGGVIDTTASGGKAIRFGTAYYVSPTGNDAADGSQASPWRTPQHAVDTASSGSTIMVLNGDYVPFTITRPGLTVTGESQTGVTFSGVAGTQNIILVSANNTTLINFTVRGCIPNPSPPSGFENSGSSGVRLNDATSGATLDHLTIRDSDKTLNSDGLQFACYGIIARNSNNFRIQNSDLSNNGDGIFIYGGGQDAVIQNNKIHDNDAEIRNTVANLNDDFGATSIGIDGVTASPGVTITGNTIYNDQGPSHDYGTDGGGLDIFQASNITITNNNFYNNENILETGAGPTGDCVNNVFRNNTATGKTTGSTVTRSVGMILRCSHNMIVDSNTLGSSANPFNWFVFDIESGGSFGGSNQGLTITNNTVTQAYELIYTLPYNPAGSAFNVDHNHFHTQSKIGQAWTGVQQTSLSDWQAVTGLDVHSTSF